MTLSIDTMLNNVSSLLLVFEKMSVNKKKGGTRYDLLFNLICSWCKKVGLHYTESIIFISINSDGNYYINRTFIDKHI